MRSARNRWRAVLAMLAAAFLQAGLPGPILDSVGGFLIGVAHADDDGDDGGGSGGGGSAGSAGGGGASAGDDSGGLRSIHAQPTRDATEDVRRFLQRIRGQNTQSQPVAPPRSTPRGPPSSIPREIVASNLQPQEIERLLAQGFRVLDRRAIGLLPGETARLRIPPRLDIATARRRVLAVAPGAIVDRNHLYRSQAAGCERAICDPRPLLSWTQSRCPARTTLALVDTGVDLANPALSGARIAAESMIGPGRQAGDPAHGTQIAILLAGRAREFTGVVPDASLLVLGAFHRRDDGDAADVFDLVTALERGAAASMVINMSLAGPPNALLERAGAVLSARGVVVVAAAGNDGAGSPPRYPAAYPWAVAVTAVDASKRAYRLAVRGPHIGFAAPGVALRLPRDAKTSHTVSGTSYAAPLVAGALLAVMESVPGQTTADGIRRLVASAEDLGAPGRDAVFGWGLAQVDAACAPSAR